MSPGTVSCRFGRLTATVAAATVVEQGTTSSSGAVVARLRGSSLQEIGRIASAALVTMPLYIPITALLVYTYREVSPWSVALFLFPAFAAQKLFLLYREQRATAEELDSGHGAAGKGAISFATALVATLDARDRYTAGHSAAVAVYARDIASRLGLAEETATTRPSLRARARHRKGRASAGSTREAGPADPGGATPHGGAPGHRRADPRERSTTTRRSHRSCGTTTSGSTAAATPTDSGRKRFLCFRGSSPSPMRTTQ